MYRYSGRSRAVTKLTFMLAFVSKLAEVEYVSAAVAAISSGDVVMWFAYPKGTSKKYSCDFNRDYGLGVAHEARASIRCDRSPSMRTGRRYASAGSSSSSVSPCPDSVTCIG